MTDFEQALMNRDGLTESEAKKARQEAREEFYRMMDDEGDYDDVSEFLLSEYGLEMDYIFDLI